MQNRFNCVYGKSALLTFCGVGFEDSCFIFAAVFFIFLRVNDTFLQG